MSILRLDSITRRFGGLVALENVSLGVAPGGIAAIIGPNGAGKTTLFNIVSGFDAPSAGRVFLDNQDITGLAPERIAARGLVRTFQLVQLFEDLTVLENVEVGRHLHIRGGLLDPLLPHRAPRREAAVTAVAQDLLQQAGLGGCAEMPASALPYGQKRLLEIARALAAEPRLLLLDEPAAGLNREETWQVATLLQQIVARGTTVLLIEHDMTLVMDVASRIVVLDFGRVIAEGTPAEVRRNPDVISAYLGQVEASLA
jgi:branched-chain amino acid transport system ATP-binding protein